MIQMVGHKRPKDHKTLCNLDEPMEAQASTTRQPKNWAVPPAPSTMAVQPLKATPMSPRPRAPQVHGHYTFTHISQRTNKQ